MPVSILGPAKTFSHEAILQYMPGISEGIIQFRETFDDVLDAVKHADCDFALLPFENSNSAGVQKSQAALARCRSHLYITDLFPHHIRLNLYCWGKDLSDIEEIRSLDVALKQAEEWISRNAPKATHNTGYSSTSHAVNSLVEIGTPRIAAIGARGIDHVPILAQDIQTEPNTTIFCRVQKNEPDWKAAAHVLVGMEDFTDKSFKELMEMAASFGCGIVSNWVVDDVAQRIGIMEIENFAINSGLHDLSAVVERRMPKCFPMGAYSGLSITELAHQKFTASL